MSLQHQDRLWAYIQLPSTAPTQTVNTGLYRLLQPLDELIVPILGQAYVRYPSVGLGTCPNPIITDQITDHYAPYCDELEYAVSNDIRMLAVTQRRRWDSNQGDDISRSKVAMNVAISKSAKTQEAPCLAP